MSLSRVNKWSLKLSKIGFCYNRNGVVYTDIQYKGNRKRESTHLVWHPQNKKKGLAILEQRIDSFINPSEPENDKTVFWLMKRYKKHHVSLLTKSAQRNILQSYSNFLTKDLYLADIEQIQEMVVENRDKLELNPNTIYNRLKKVRQTFAYAVDEGLIARNPITKRIFPKQIEPEKKIFTKKEFNKIKKYFKDKDRKEVVLLLEFIYITGVRIGEAVKIRWEDI